MLKFISMVLMSISVLTRSIREDICPISPLRPRNAFSQQTFLLKLHCTYGYINFEKASPTFMGGFGFWGLESSLVFFGQDFGYKCSPWLSNRMLMYLLFYRTIAQKWYSWGSAPGVSLHYIHLGWNLWHERKWFFHFRQIEKKVRNYHFHTASFLKKTIYTVA